MKVSELTGAELDFWAAKAEGKAVLILNNECFLGIWHSPQGDVGLCSYSPSTDWSQGGPIIERMKPTSFYYWEPTGLWTCAWGNGPRWATGVTPLIAAMRCLVASKFGEEVDDSQAHNVQSR